jgi:DNA-3-methyladenine glycosylase II
MSRAALLLEPVPPFRLDLTVWTLRRRPDNIIDRWDGETYRRVLPLPGGAAEVAVTQVGPPEAPRLRVAWDGSRRAAVKAAVTAALERLLGLRVDLTGWFRRAARQGRLGRLARRFLGMKPPRMLSVFEAAVNAMACQQVTLTLGIRLLNRLAENYGATGRAFPRPEELARATPAALRRLGFSTHKGRAMIELARSVAVGRLDLEGLAALPDEEAVARLVQLRGVGRWTAEYVLLRGLGRLHVFPGDDVGGRNNLRRYLNLTEPLDYDGTRRTLQPLKDYGGLIYFHLLLDRLAEAGYLTSSVVRAARLHKLRADEPPALRKRRQSLRGEDTYDK